MDQFDEQKNPVSHREPWDADSYQTGSTKPPKSHRGIIALVLVLGIVLGSAFTVLADLRLKLVEEWKESHRDTEMSVALNAGEDTGGTLAPQTPEDPTDAPIDTTEATQTPGTPGVPLQTSPQGVDTPSQEDGLSLQEIYRKCIPSTVSILCYSGSSSSSGTGVILTSQGYVITNCHVVDGAQQIQVLLTDGRYLDAQLVGSDKLSDLAVLHVEAEDLMPAEFGDSDMLRVGDTVVAIGDPLGVELRGTMTDGIVSAINRDITTEGRTLTLIQTNAALNSGNSGGPLINCYGQVIGINTMKIGDYVSSAGVEGLGFAIPSTTVKQIAEQLIAQGYVSGRPGLGIDGTDVPDFYRYYYRLPAGVYINALTPGSEAEAKGLEIGDILVAVDDVRIESVEDLQTALYAYQAGDTVKIQIYRNGKYYQTQLVLEEATS